MMHRIVSTNRVTGGRSESAVLFASRDHASEEAKRADVAVPENQHTVTDEPCGGGQSGFTMRAILYHSILAVLIGSVAIYAYVMFVTDASPPPTIPPGEYWGMQSKQ